MARSKKEVTVQEVEEVIEKVAPEVKIEEVVVMDSLDMKIKLVTAKEARSPRFKPI